ncbi:MAG: EMC3/TMCO1 family protein [Nanoarchaeota archaeon]
MKGFTLLFVLMLASVLIASLWSAFPFIKENVHLILDPTAGRILEWNITLGMLLITAAITFVMTLFQKYGTDQATLKQMRDEQKIAREEMKKYKDNPEKLLEFNKKQIEDMPKLMEMNMKPLIFTFLPIILFFRWFNDYFFVVNFKFFGFLSWFWFYLIFSIIFSSVFRKILRVV